jgi:hypothetical protein
MRIDARVLFGLSALVFVGACEVGSEETTKSSEAIGVACGADFPAPGPTTVDTPIGLAIEIDGGVATPLRVRKGQRFYMNQIDLRVAIDAAVDEGVKGLSQAGDFASLDWRDVALADESPEDLPNADGTFVRRRFYRGARWMERPSFLVIEQIDAAGHDTAFPVVVSAGSGTRRTPLDGFFVRRMRAIQWGNDCTTPTDCSQATHFSEEALVELRDATSAGPSLKMRPSTTALRVSWTAKPGAHWDVPVEQVASPNWDYGFDMDIAALTPPAADGTYAPGQSVTFQFTLKDGSGKRLHAPGTMPSYADVISGVEPSGIQYWRGPLEKFTTYYRRKHKERQLLLAVMGPRQDDKPIYQVVDLLQRMDFSTGIITSATPAGDGIFAAATGIPSFLAVLSGPAAWSLPSTDTWTFTIPPDAEPGTYTVVLKGRRAYLGEDIPRARELRIQVGTSTPTEASLGTGHCEGCHQGGGDLKRVLHGFDDRAACTACHAPLTFEREGPVFVRAHFIHSRSKRVDADLSECKTCHLTVDSIQRTSKAACLSCHKSYPASHVASFGPVTNMYVGGGDESFQSCTTTCHQNHPGSGL